MKTVNFSETIEACDLKVGRYRQINDYIQQMFLCLKIEVKLQNFLTVNNLGAIEENLS